MIAAVMMLFATGILKNEMLRLIRARARLLYKDQKMHDSPLPLCYNMEYTAEQSRDRGAAAAEPRQYIWYFIIFCA